ncbi:hypothetical protein F5Y17DRAFT_469174 [Xylariaceae sp. FL0594]|nr:hypothetical protein F5Y17DRAFT_469174 [Xylariaceae sp. FL0594]
MSRDDGAGGPTANDSPTSPKSHHHHHHHLAKVNSKGDSNGNGHITNGDTDLSRRLADLPEPLLAQVFMALERSELCNVSRVNKRWHEVADSILYNKVHFGNPEHHMAFGQSLTRRGRRGSAIHSARLEYPMSELSHLSLNGDVAVSHHALAHLDTLSHTIASMSNLRELEVSVPDKMCHGIGALLNGPFDLACLRSCSLFYQTPDNGYWDLRENIHIFAHPTLETLYIRRAKLDYRGFDFNERPHMLPLKRLHLIECDISDDALSDLMELPEALTNFVMTQSSEPQPELEESSDNMGDYIVALSSQQHSLESITIDFPTLGSRRALRMQQFEALKSLRVNWDWQLFGKTRTSRDGKKVARIHSFGVPPNLKILEFFNELGTDEEVTELLDYLLETSPLAAKAINKIPIRSLNDVLARPNHSLIPVRRRKDSYNITLI